LIDEKLINFEFLNKFWSKSDLQQADRFGLKENFLNLSMT